VLSDNIAVDVWSKYLFVGPIGSITSMLALPFGAIMENDDHKKMLEEMMREVKMIAYAKGVSLPEDIIERSMGIASGFSYNTKSSLQLDFEKKKKTEVETFTGYVVKSGKELGVKTPLHDRVYSELIKRTL
jgi:2-dehydropantoate 2-reductase